MNPTNAVDTAARLSPKINSFRRPSRSDRYPLGMTTEMLPTANAVSATPAAPGPRPSTSTTNSGTSAIRSPNDAQPVAKFDSSAARYARCRNTVRNGTGSSTSPSDRAITVELRRLTNTTVAATSSAAP